MMCGSWPPAGSRWRWPGRPGTGWRRWPCPDLDDLAGAAGAEAVALFADRARSADAHFVLDDQTGPVVARLVTRLDGMPLAIELAAARVEALGVAQLLDRLDDRFALLAAGTGWRRRGSGRWRPRWSGVTSCWMRLSGGCSAGCRCSRGRSRWRRPRRSPGPAPTAAVLHLVDCSLLVPPAARSDGRPRYAMLETLRAYGSRLLDQSRRGRRGRSRAGRVRSGGGRAGRRRVCRPADGRG